MAAPEVHARLSASSSHRWLNCPPSVMLAEQFPSTTSPYAEAGRLAHAIAELKARKYFLEPMSTRVYNAQLKKLQADPSYDPAMKAATDTYLEHLKELALSFPAAPFVTLETRVDFSNYVPYGFGTADCIMIGSGRICVVDYKNGAGEPVEAENNPQMSLYALGALQVYAPIFGDTIQEVRLTIVQPHAGGVKSWSTTAEHLRQWGENVVAPTAALAAAGGGEFSAGGWCRFCPAKSQCAARAKQMLELEPTMLSAPQDPALLSNDQIGDILTRARRLAAWVGDLEDYALKAAMAGETIPDWKVVEGRGSRDWTDLDTAFRSLQARGVAEALLWERKPVSVAGLEKAMGKKSFAEVTGDLVIKKPGKPTLVPSSDKRPPYNAANIAFNIEKEI